MGLKYAGKVTIVTGGSKGIGEGCVRVFVANGSKVVFCARGEEAGRKLQTELNSKGPGECFFVKCDVTKEEELKKLVDFTVAKYGQIDCLINNAGWHPDHRPIDDFSVQEFKDLLNFNLVSYFAASKFALPHLRKTRGNIINMTSLVAQIGQAGATTYVATKGGISSFTKALAIDEAQHAVRVNCISPGNIWTPLWETNANMASDPTKVIEGGEDAQLLGRMGTIAESGLAALYLAADATFCTGIDLPLSGGAELSYGFKNRIKATSSSIY